MPGIEARAPERTETSKGLPGSPKLAPTILADIGQRRLDLVRQSLGILIVVAVKAGADLGGDGETGRHRQAEIGHLGEIGALAAEQRLHAGAAFGAAAAKAIDEFFRSWAIPDLAPATNMAVMSRSSGERRAVRRRAHQQPKGDRHIDQVEGDAVEERRLVGAGKIVDLARHPAAQRHAHHGRGEDEADPHARLARRKMIADDEGIAWHDAALRQAEQSRDDIERGQAVEGDVEEERQHLQRRADDEGHDAADAVGDEAGGEPAHHAGAAIRSIISIPAGMERMNLGLFLTYTAIGSAIWTTRLTYLGYFLGKEFEAVGKYLNIVSSAVIGIIVLIYIIRVIRHK